MRYKIGDKEAKNYNSNIWLLPNGDLLDSISYCLVSPCNYIVIPQLSPKTVMSQYSNLLKKGLINNEIQSFNQANR